MRCARKGAHHVLCMRSGLVGSVCLPLDQDCLDAVVCCMSTILPTSTVVFEFILVFFLYHVLVGRFFTLLCMGTLWFSDFAHFVQTFSQTHALTPTKLKCSHTSWGKTLYFVHPTYFFLYVWHKWPVFCRLIGSWDSSVAAKCKHEASKQHDFLHCMSCQYTCQ